MGPCHRPVTIIKWVDACGELKTQPTQLVMIVECGGKGETESGVSQRFLPEQLGGNGAIYGGDVNLA